MRSQRIRMGARRLAALWLFAAIGAALPVEAQFPRLSAGMGYGVGGLFHKEYVADALQSSRVGGFSGATYTVELGYLFASHAMVGLRAHSLQVDLGNGTRAGTLDLLPATLFLAYRRPALLGSLGGFAGAGIGAASARFTPAATIDHWRPWDSATIDVTHERPFVAEFFAGADARLSDDFSLELALASTLMDTEIAYRPQPIDGEAGGFTPGHSYRVQGRHLVLALSLRWWVEWW
jgi:hypothetical protein